MEYTIKETINSFRIDISEDIKKTNKLADFIDASANFSVVETIIKYREKKSFIIVDNINKKDLMTKVLLDTLVKVFIKQNE